MPGEKQSGGFHMNIFFIYLHGTVQLTMKGINLGDNTNTLGARQLSFHDHNAFPLLAVEHMPWI